MKKNNNNLEDIRADATVKKEYIEVVNIAMEIVYQKKLKEIAEIAESISERLNNLGVPDIGDVNLDPLKMVCADTNHEIPSEVEKIYRSAVPQMILNFLEALNGKF